MMKKWTLHIYIIPLLASLLASCSSTLDEKIIQEQEKVGITFTLSMSSVGATSRSLTADMVTLYENTIAQDKFRVLAYTTSGEVHEITIFSMQKIAENTYEISGELKGNHLVDKVVVLANCDKSFNPTTSSLNMLTYSYLKSSFNPESPQSYIPMWGVKKITTPLELGANTNIGTISLLRAMAKIQVALSEVSIGCELTQVTMTRYNTQGACVPNTFNSVDETADVAEVTIPEDAVAINSNLDFYKTEDGSYILYLPEYKNKESQYLADISVTVKDINKVDHKKTIEFGKYNSGSFASEYWDILRNHYYAFNLRLEVAANGELDLNVKTEKYAEFELKPVYGD